MYVVRSRSRGLADVPQTPAALPATINGVPIAQYCSDWIKWPWTGYCWAYSPAAWGQMANFAGQAATLIPQPAPPPAVTNLGVSETQPPTVEQAAAATDAAIAAAAEATKAQNLAAFRSMIPVADSGGGDGGGLSTFALIALGLVAGGAVLLLGSGRGRR